MRFAFLVLTLTCALSAPAFAQEVQVPLDESGRIMVIDQRTENFEEIFPEYRGFQEARLFRVADDAYVLEVLYRPDDDVLRDRRTLTLTEVEALRSRVSAAMPSAAPTAERIDQSGRARLLRQAAISSLLLYGPALPIALDVDDTGAGTALYLATASAGFFIPFFLTKDAPVTQGAATLSRVGASQGALHGFTLTMLLAGFDASERAVFGLTALGSAAEAVIGYKLGIAHGTGRGEAETIGAGGLFGSIAGLGLGGILSVEPEEDRLLGPDEDPDLNSNDDDFYDDDDYFETNARILSGSALVGSLAGLYAGYALAQTEPYTRGDARVFSTLGFLGVNAGVLAIDLSNTENGRVGSGMIVAGTVAGVAAGRFLTMNRDFTAAQGAYVGLGAAAGALAGFSVASLIDAAPTPSYVLGTAGATLGFGLMYAAFDDDARAASASHGLGALDLEVNPLGLMAAVRGGGAAGMQVFRVSAKW